MNTSSNTDSANERLIRDLVTDLIPVRRLRPPSVRALAWLAVVVAHCHRTCPDRRPARHSGTDSSRPPTCGSRSIGSP